MNEVVNVDDVVLLNLEDYDVTLQRRHLRWTRTLRWSDPMGNWRYAGRHKGAYYVPTHDTNPTHVYMHRIWPAQGFLPSELRHLIYDDDPIRYEGVQNE